MFCDWRMVGPLAEAVAGEEKVRAEQWRVSQAIVWDRELIGMGSPFRNRYEMIAFAPGPTWTQHFGKDQPTLIRHRWPYGQHDHHPSEKPVALLRQLIEYASTPTIKGRAALVLDPFMGSGSTGLAALEAGRAFVGIEIDPKHFETACQRIAQRQESLTV